MFIRLVYLSDAKQKFDDLQLQELEQLAVKKNQSLGISGYLNFNQGVFLQYLEGEAWVVNELLKVIEQDPRHRVVTVLRLGENTERMFPNWSMRYLAADRIVEIGLEEVLAEVLRSMRSPVFATQFSTRIAMKLCKSIASQTDSCARLTDN